MPEERIDVSSFPLAAAADRMRRAARDIGVREDQPDGVFVQAMADALAGFEQRLKAHRELPMEDVERATCRAARHGLEQAARSLQRHEQRRTLALMAAVTFALMVGAFASGFAVGWENAGAEARAAETELRPVFSSGLQGAGWLASLARLNDLSRLESQCRASRYRQADGEACEMRIWVTPPAAR